MSDENEKFSVESFLKKVQEGDKTLLIVGAIVMIIPMVALFFLTGGKTDKKMTQQKLRTMVQRRNVFNFGTKEDGTKSAPKSGLPSKSSNWFGSRTPAQKIADEIHRAEQVIEQKASVIEVPPELTGDHKKQYLAEHNYHLCCANGAIELKNYAEAEELLKKALDEAKDNAFLEVYALGSLCALYERTGDAVKMEAAYKQYIEAVSKIPPEFGGGDLKRVVRDAYQALATVGNYATPEEITDALEKEPLVQKGVVPSNINIREVYKSFPIKYE